MKHDPMIRVLGVWYRIETDKQGKLWAVSDTERRPYGEGLTVGLIDSVRGRM